MDPYVAIWFGILVFLVLRTLYRVGERAVAEKRTLVDQSRDIYDELVLLGGIPYPQPAEVGQKKVELLLELKEIETRLKELT